MTSPCTHSQVRYNQDASEVICGYVTHWGCIYKTGSPLIHTAKDQLIAIQQEKEQHSLKKKEKNGGIIIDPLEQWYIPPNQHDSGYRHWTCLYNLLHEQLEISVIRHAFFRMLILFCIAHALW